MKAWSPLFSYYISMKKYILKSGLSLDGTAYNAGDVVELTMDQYHELSDIIEESAPYIETSEPEDTPKTLRKMSIEELQGILTENGMEFDPNASKKALIALIETEPAAPEAEPATPTEVESVTTDAE